jgi:hypothetical protein
VRVLEDDRLTDKEKLDAVMVLYGDLSEYCHAMIQALFEIRDAASSFEAEIQKNPLVHPQVMQALCAQFKTKANAAIMLKKK